MPPGSVGDEGQVRGPTQNGGSEAVEEAEGAEHEHHVVAPDHDPEPESGPARVEDPLEEEGEDEEDVEGDGLHGVEADVVAEGRVADDAEVEGEEGDEGGVGDGLVEGEEGEERVEEEGEGGVLEEEEAAVLEGVEEGEGVGRGGDEAVGGRSRVVGHTGGGGGGASVGALAAGLEAEGRGEGGGEGGGRQVAGLRRGVWGRRAAEQGDAEQGGGGGRHF